MKTKNLLKLSILELELLKEASTQATKDSLLEALALKVRNRLTEADDDDDVEVTTEDDLELPIEELDTLLLVTLLDILGEIELPLDLDLLFTDIDAEIELELDNLDLDLDLDLLDLPIEEDLDELDIDMDEMLLALILDLIEDEMLLALILDLIEQLIKSLSDDDEDEIYLQEVDELLFERIKGIIESLMNALLDLEVDSEVVLAFKREVKKLTSENKQYKKTLSKIKTDLFETRMMTIKGKLVVGIFNNFDLTKKQKVKIIERFDKTTSERLAKLLYSKLMLGLRLNKKIPRKRKTNIMSDTMKSTKTTKPMKSIKENTQPVDDSLKAIRDVFRRKVGILD